MKSFSGIAGGLAVLGLVFAQGCCCKKKETELEKREISGYATTTAVVQSVDLEKREITLKGENGTASTFTVDTRVKRLDEIEAGDKIRVSYYVSLASEIRDPTEAEKKEPLLILEEKARAPEDTAPAAGGLRQIRAVVTIKDIDVERNLITIKGPMGRYLTVRAVFPDRLKQLKVEDTAIVTYTEALAVSVEKVE